MIEDEIVAFLTNTDMDAPVLLAKKQEFVIEIYNAHVVILNEVTYCFFNIVHHSGTDYLS